MKFYSKVYTVVVSTPNGLPQQRTLAQTMHNEALTRGAVTLSTVYSNRMSASRQADITDLARLTTSHRCLAMGLLHNYLDDPGSRPAQSMHALYMIQLAVHPVVYIHTHTRLTAFVRDYPGEPVPER